MRVSTEAGNPQRWHGARPALVESFLGTYLAFKPHHGRQPAKVLDQAQLRYHR